MPEHSPLIELSHVRFHYPDSSRPAIDDFSLRIEKGEFLAVLGHNGSGKSTLAKLLNALFVPTDGVVRVDGADTAPEDAQWEARKRCGMVFQNPDNQLVATVVEEDVAFGLENLGVPSGEIRARVDEALTMVGMKEFALRAPHMLSGGQKQRVAIAGVIAMRPQVIVFDEATAMLDPAGRLDVMEIAQKLNRKEGITVVWITHFMEEAVRADRVAVISDGTLTMLGTPEDVFSQTDALKRQGLDAPPMMELANSLREAGIPLPKTILSVEEMVVELCRLR